MKIQIRYNVGYLPTLKAFINRDGAVLKVSEAFIESKKGVIMNQNEVKVFAYFYNDEGKSVTVSTEDIVKETGLSKSVVRIELSSLIKKKVLIRVEEDNR